MIRKSYKSLLFSKAIEDNPNKFLSLIYKDNDAFLLDCGCGYARLTKKIAEALGSDNVFGIDLDRVAIKHAHGRGVESCCADLNQPFPFKNNAFDVVVSDQVIEHLSDVDKFVEEVYRVLKPDGYVVVSTPNLSSWHNILSLIMGYQDFDHTLMISNEYCLGNPLHPEYCNKIAPSISKHVKIFTYRSLRDIFEFHGFVVEDVKGAGYYPFIIRLGSVLASLDPRHARYILLKARKPKK